MTKKEIVKLFALIRTEYAHFENTDEKRQLWHELMINLSFEQAVINLKAHIVESEFVPKAANIIKKDPDQFTDYAKLRQETQIFLQQADQRRLKAIDCPPEYSRKQLTGGVKHD